MGEEGRDNKWVYHIVSSTYFISTFLIQAEIRKVCCKYPDQDLCFRNYQCSRYLQGKETKLKYEHSLHLKEYFYHSFICFGSVTD